MIVNGYNVTHLADRFTVNPNGRDVHIRCNACGESKAGSLAMAWAGSHICGIRPVRPFRTEAERTTWDTYTDQQKREWNALVERGVTRGGAFYEIDWRASKR